MDPDQYPLRGKLTLITGCTGGIGQATARALARLGSSIAIHYVSPSSESIAQNLLTRATLPTLTPPSVPVETHVFQADLSTYEGAEKLYAEVVQAFGGKSPDVLFANHGTTGPKLRFAGGIEDISVEVFEKLWRTNTGTTFRLTQLCLPHMQEQKWGRVILTSRCVFTSWMLSYLQPPSSVAAQTGGVIGPHYASSKSALHGLMHWVSQRYAGSGITSNVISPALISDTVMMSDAPPELANKIPIGRFGRPEEIASVVALVATNDYMTNKVISVDGGWTS